MDNITRAYCLRVAEGATPYEATLALVGEGLLRPAEAANQQWAWEHDLDVLMEIQRLKDAAQAAKKGLRDKLLNRLVASALVDPRGYWEAKYPGSKDFNLRPPSQWTKEQAHAVKNLQVKTRKYEDGSEEQTVTLAFWDAHEAVKMLHELHPKDLMDASDLLKQAENRIQLPDGFNV